MGLESLEKRETVEIYDSCFSILILFFFNISIFLVNIEVKYARRKVCTTDRSSERKLAP